MLLPTNEQWGIVDFIAQEPYFGENPKDGYYPVDWDQMYIFPASFAAVIFMTSQIHMHFGLRRL
jgi:hypothetical protein